MAPVEAATLVLKAAYLGYVVSWWLWHGGWMLTYIARTVALRVEPPLNPNQPNQISTVPRKTRVVL
jgi:hypothetical protein